MKHFFQIIITLSVLCTSVFAGDDHFKFYSNEHVDIGDKVVLYFSATDYGQSNIPLHLPNGVTLSYGDLISLGDFYGNPDQPISHGDSVDEMKSLFLAAFDQFSGKESHAEEVRQIIYTIHELQHTVALGLEQGKSEEQVFKEIGDKYERRFNCLTGGGCEESTWWLYFGRYITLANTNFDHFGENALISYRIGHSLAIEQAIQASQTNDVKKLETAYAMNAFACHFLSDRYAAGHIRTPRNEMANVIYPNIVASLLVRYMHDEENLYGLHVHNNLGEQWVAVGDKSNLSPRALKHQNEQLAALQVSADEIFKAYQEGVAPDKDLVEDYIPYPDELSPNAHLDIAALFYWDDINKQLMARLDLDNRYGAEWTSYWWSWLTLVNLSFAKPLPISEQALLAQSQFAEDALNQGLINDPRVMAHLH